MSASLRRSDRTSEVVTGPRHFLDLRDFEPATLRQMLEVAANYKRGGTSSRPLAGKTLALIFEKPSTRTRVSFEVGMRQLGGDVIVLSARDMQSGRGESPADTARVLSRYVDAIMLRTDNVAKLHELAEYATVPVINGLTDTSHPCQLMADVLTFEEHRGPIAGEVVAWCGDGNNVARSWIEAAVRFGFTLRLATPDALRPPAELIAWARAQGGRIIPPQQRPQVGRRVHPTYPKQATARKLHGSVVLQAIINKQGKVDSLQLVSGDPVLAQAAAAAVKQWRYKPYSHNGEPADFQTRVTVDFKLP